MPGPLDTNIPSANEEAIIALMGPTGTGKSSFINLLTNDENIRVGYDLHSRTFDVKMSNLDEAGRRVTLVDTPGFDDSREGVTDTDILGKIVNFLQDNGGRKINGIIYLHRISDPRMGGTTKKNLRMFRELCGDKNFGHVRIITTFWKRMDEGEGRGRETELADGAFKPLIDRGAQMFRHDRGLESARSIVSQLAKMTPVKLKIQEELDAGRALGDTSAGAVILEEMRQVQAKHDKEMEEMKKEMEEAEATDEELRAELAEECRKLEARLALAERDRKTLKMARQKGSRAQAEAMALPNSVVGQHLHTARDVPTLPKKTQKEPDPGASKLRNLVGPDLGAALKRNGNGDDDTRKDGRRTRPRQELEISTAGSSKKTRAQPGGSSAEAEVTPKAVVGKDIQHTACDVGGPTLPKETEACANDRRAKADTSETAMSWIQRLKAFMRRRLGK